MSEPLSAPAGESGPDVARVEEFYVRRVDWLITTGRADLIDEIADDCERRRAAPPAAGPKRHLATVSTIDTAHTAAVRAGASSPRPVETGTRLAAARLRRSRRAGAWPRP